MFKVAKDVQIRGEKKLGGKDAKTLIKQLSERFNPETTTAGTYPALSEDAFLPTKKGNLLQKTGPHPISFLVHSSDKGGGGNSGDSSAERWLYVCGDSKNIVGAATYPTLQTLWRAVEAYADSAWEDKKGGSSENIDKKQKLVHFLEKIEGSSTSSSSSSSLSGEKSSSSSSSSSSISALTRHLDPHNVSLLTLKRIIILPQVVSYLLNGADLMLKGCLSMLMHRGNTGAGNADSSSSSSSKSTNPYAGKFADNEIVLVMVVGNPYPVAVGKWQAKCLEEGSGKIEFRY
jgi:hypothetical protein